MSYNYNQKKPNKSVFGSAVSAVASFLSKGWDIVETPSQTRCEAYASQAAYAQEHMHKDGISRKERRYWSKQNDKAMNGLAEVHHTDSDTLVNTVVAVGAGLLLAYKLFNKR